MDYRLVEFVFSLPTKSKVGKGFTKLVLREAMKGFLPDEILTRPKMGFPVPIGRWFRGPFRMLLDEYVLGSRPTARQLFDTAYVQRLVAQHEHGQGDHSERLWSLVNFEIWQRQFLDGESVADTSAHMTRLLGTRATSGTGGNTPTTSLLAGSAR